MITIEDKLDIFYKLVLEKEREQGSKIIDEIKEKNRVLLEDYEKKLLEKKDEIIEESVRNGELKKDELISQRIIEARKKIFNKKEELLEDLILGLEKKAEDFVCSKEYEDYLLRDIKEVLNNIEDESIILYLKDEDRYNFSSSIVKIGEDMDKKISFKNPKENILGGFLVSDINEKYLIDESFRGKIEENKYLIGELLYSTLEKAGDILD
ncbi:V-type ATP synthase subunit E [Anaerosalibacter massiliensis]|uniref:V-type ATP synthase subunit E family protein n=1 Tax=Anaerosalibacter massiliensis TaxID=1347392 RepID=A0A9X2MIH0_9FIRM|nr:V-type ATP synthase subunit E family protein [Anaerosalibacter massiliensis]MCR2044319.1 V-type ATP synthase subunit E family protein [Anaerosalibacter massiliensis]